jgi:alkylation response protein AidB-like acyl-CoA dehydrogenase
MKEKLVNVQAIQEQIRQIAAHCAQDRHDRQRRRALDPADIALLQEAGFYDCAVPVEQGGIWENVPRSTRPIGEMLRALAGGDSSLALVASMHPSVLIFWLATQNVPEPHAESWQKQCTQLFQMAHQGAVWGTITSEPGSGGDIMRTKSSARLNSAPNNYRLSGLKHFGSGSGVTSYMVTMAVPEDGTMPDLFYLDLRDVPWDGSTGATLVSEWDGHGMLATQSHSLRFEDFPATRSAWPGHLQELAGAAMPSILCWFSAVIVGIVETATQTARKQLAARQDSLRPYDQVEWVRAEMETWLIQQAYEGMLSAVEQQRANAGREVLQGKMAIAELAESVLQRICRVAGGGSYARHSPFGFWYEDVRALGYLRPPWSLAYGNLIKSAFDGLP